MARFIAQRTLGAIVVVFVISFVTFLIFQIGPTLAKVNPVYLYIGKVPFKPGSPQLLALEHKFGFDLPWYAQYWHYLTGFFGQYISDGTSAPVTCPFPCLGYSFQRNELVTQLIGEALPTTISLCLGAAILWLLGGVLVGTLSALQPRSIVDRVGMGLSLGAVSLPIFFTGPVFLLVFSYTLGWLPANGYVPLTTNPVQWFLSLLGPWLCLAFLFAALYARLTRSNMIETMGEDYIRTARAKGLSRNTVVVRHGLRAALTPVVTIFGIDIGQLVGTTVITETVFNLRGLGYLAYNAVSNSDIPVVLGVTVLAALVLVVANLLVDVVYAFIDPRVTV